MEEIQLNKISEELEKKCISQSVGLSEKITFFFKLLEVSKETAKDVLMCWQDSLSYFKDRRLQGYLEMLDLLSQDKRIPSVERLYIATSIHNRGYVSISFEMFKKLSTAKSLDDIHRIEACKYLLSSGENAWKDHVKGVLFDMIRTHSPKKGDSEKRYNFIRTFNTKTGLTTILNSTKLKFPRDKKFIKDLLIEFFNDKENDTDQRIKSGQSLLQLQSTLDSPKIPSDEEYAKISLSLLSFAKDENEDELIRAKAADVVYRLGIIGHRKEALVVIAKLGTDDKVCSVYENKQNTHNKNISESVLAFIESVIDEIQIGDMTILQVADKIRELVSSSELDSEARSNVKKAINRICMDEAKFTSYDITVSEFLVYIWLKIHTFPNHKEMYARLLQELSEMPDGCSSGHISRIVNVIPGAIRISWEDQIQANMLGRLGAAMREGSKDIDELAPEEYKEMLKAHLLTIEKDLTIEFVGECHITQEEFQDIFQRHSAMIMEQWGM